MGNKLQSKYLIFYITNFAMLGSDHENKPIKVYYCKLDQ